MSAPSLASLQPQRKQIREQLAAVGRLRPGSLVERCRECGKSSRHCARQGCRGHGPQFSLTRPLCGKTVTRIIPKGPAVKRAREQIGDLEREQERSAEADGD